MRTHPTIRFFGPPTVDFRGQLPRPTLLSRTEAPIARRRSQPMSGARDEGITVPQGVHLVHDQSLGSPVETAASAS
jgi:hypothetical protein